jgi:hypothetical protein
LNFCLLKVNGLRHTAFTIDDSELRTKNVFNPIATANKPIRHNQQTQHNKPIMAQPFVISKTTEDRFSIKRLIPPPYIVNKTKVEFAPIKNEV